jgi:hypothetical protein
MVKTDHEPARTRPADAAYDAAVPQSRSSSMYSAGPRADGVNGVVTVAELAGRVERELADARHTLSPRASPDRRTHP